MKSIFDEKYIETAEQRLKNQMINRKKNNHKINNIELSLDQKRKLNNLDVEDRLYFLRNLNPG